MFDLSPGAGAPADLADMIFIPDALDGVIEGAVLEHTLLARDEMANLAWAIEKTVQGVSGEPMDRAMEAKTLAFQQRIVHSADTTADVIYRLASPVPANWIPLLPVRKHGLDLSKPLEIQLERAGMKRFYPAAAAAGDDEYAKFLEMLAEHTPFIDPIDAGEHVKAFVFHPRGWLLRRDPTAPMPANDTLVLEEEEVPRIGASLKRTFQYARSSDGRSWLWIGRRKIAGRGEAASQLRFDAWLKATADR
jgi:hypothetical protein